MKKRAIQSEDKETKRRQIVVAARNLFTERDFFSVKMEDVAAKAGVAKGTLYLYFGTKEELFLAVAESELADWFESLFGAVESVASRNEGKYIAPSEIPRVAGELSAVVAATFKKHPTIPRDLSLLFNILEHNVSDEKLVAFKSQLLDQLDALCAHFTRLLGCETDACWKLQLGLQSVMLGAWQLAKPSAKSKAIVGTSPGLAKLSPPFEDFLEWCVRNFVAGFLAEPAYFSARRG